jgi:hypothetical protein
MHEVTNPFATRYTRPGAMAFRFPPGVSAAALVDKLADAQWRGQILGPHGSGKTTLLSTLAEELTARGRSIVSFVQHDGARRLNASADEASAWDAQTQVIIDGYEQLGWGARWWIERTCRKQQAGLLITTHADVGLPLLIETSTSEQLAAELVAQLLAEPSSLIGSEDVSRCYREHAGNLRETLFALYDLYELRRRSAS